MLFGAGFNSLRVILFIDLMVCVMLHIGHTYSSGSVADIRVSKQNFDDAFKKVRPSVSKKVRKYEQYSSCCASFKTLIDLLAVEKLGYLQSIDLTCELLQVQVMLLL